MVGIPGFFVREVVASCKKFDVIGPSEVHGSPTLQASYLSLCTKPTSSFAAMTGLVMGTVILLPEGSAFLSETFCFAPPLPPAQCFQLIVKGQAASLTLNCLADEQIPMFFIHNFGGMKAAMTSLLVGKIQHARNICAKYPTSIFLIAFGDFNLIPEASTKISLLDSSSISGAFKSRTLPRPFEKAWTALFNDLIEVDCPIPSHINPSTLSPTRTNRMFVFLLGPSVPLIKLSAGVRKDTAWFEAKGLSDHASYLWCLVFFLKAAQPTSPGTAVV